MPCREDEPYDEWIRRFDLNAVGVQFVRRWPPLIYAIRQYAAVIGYDPNELVAHPFLPSPERDKRARYISSKFADVWQSPDDKELLEAIAAEVGQTYMDEKRSEIGAFHELFEHIEARVRFAYDKEARRIEVGLERSADRAPRPRDEQARLDEEAIRGRVSHELAERVVQVYRGVSAYTGEEVPMKALKALGISATTVERYISRHKPGSARPGQGKAYPKSYLVAYIVNRWTPRRPTLP